MHGDGLCRRHFWLAMGALGFTVFGRLVPYYGLMIAVGIIAASLAGFWQVHRKRLQMLDLILIAAVCGLLGLIGAKLLYFVVAYDTIDWKRFFTDAWYNSLMMGSGFVYLGGTFGAVLGLWLCGHLFKVPVQPYVQHCMGCLPLAHAFGRVGCHLVGCCYGRAYSGPLAVTYTQSLFAPGGVARFPVQLTEAGAEMMIALCLFAVSNRLPGYTALYWYLMSYGIVRFVLEMLRGDPRGSVLGLSTSQALCLVMVVFAAVLLIRNRVKFTQSIDNLPKM